MKIPCLKHANKHKDYRNKKIKMRKNILGIKKCRNLLNKEITRVG